MRRLRARFSATIYANTPTRAEETVAGRRLVYHDVSDLDEVSQAFLNRRFLAKEEVWPKMHVQRGLAALAPLEALQRLYPLGRFLCAEELSRARNARRVDAQLLFSLFFEPHFKDALDEYARKLCLCGVAAPLPQLGAYEALKARLDALLRAFFAAELSPLDRLVERNYLAVRYTRMYWLGAGGIGVVFSLQNYKRMQGLRNFRCRDLLFFDDFAPAHDVG